jgi:hypothetical protein
METFVVCRDLDKFVYLITFWPTPVFKFPIWDPARQFISGSLSNFMYLAHTCIRSNHCSGLVPIVLCIAQRQQPPFASL